MEVVGNRSVIYEFGKFVLDPSERTLRSDGRAIHLPAKGFEILLLLVEHSGHVLTKEEMIAAIWKDSFVEENNLAKHISKLRKTINTDGQEFIETVPKYGYRFSADLRLSFVESEAPIIFEKRTLRRFTFAIDDGVEKRSLLPSQPKRTGIISVGVVASVLLITGLGLGYLAWNSGQKEAIDPYAPVRLTDDQNHDTGPQWTKDGRIQFFRLYPDRSETWIMNADGSDPTPIRMPEGKTIFRFSPDERKVLFHKPGDESNLYLSDADGSREISLECRSATWSADSKMVAYHKRISATDFDIFLYSLETGEVRNLTKHEAFDADPAFSPDGKKVVFSSKRDGNPEIYSIDLEDGELSRLTFNPATDSHAAYSPDGTEILFTSDRDNENADVYVMNADGSGDPVKLTGWDKSNETAGPGAWSPDGTKIAFFSDRDGKDDIYVVSAERVRPKLVLADAEQDLSWPSISPDGSKLAYSEGMEDRSGELRSLDFGSQSSSLIRKTAMSQINAEWSPDGNWIAFSDRIDGNSELFRVRPDGSDLKQLTHDPSTDACPAWSLDGLRLIFITSRGEPRDLPQIYLMDSDGDNPHPLTRQKGWEGEPVFSPGDGKIVFVCDRGDSPGKVMDVCEIDEDGGNERRLVSLRDQESHPVVSPDGKRIAFTSRSDGNVEIYLVNRDGSGLLRLTRNPADDQMPEWSPDGRGIFFASNRGGRSAIYYLEL